MESTAAAKIERELSQAAAARAAGNEGQARVCARRAAGIAIREYLKRQGEAAAPAQSATDLLQWLQSQPGIPGAIHQIAEHLLVRVTPDFQLPIQADLLAETRQLISLLEALPFSAV